MAKQNIIQQHWKGIVLGLVIMTLLVVYVGPVFQQVACRWAKNLGNQTCEGDCSGGGGGGSSGGVWDGECTREITDECCDEPTFEVRMCAGQTVYDPRDCYDLYCESDGQKCNPVPQITTTGYKCTCGSAYSEEYPR